MYGGSKQDQPTSIEQTSDGGYIVLGFTYSDDGDVPGNHSHRRDYWALRLDANGNIIWSKNYGGSHHEVSGNIIEANDGGFIMIGYTNTNNNGDISGKYEIGRASCRERM